MNTLQETPVVAGIPAAECGHQSYCAAHAYPVKAWEYCSRECPRLSPGATVKCPKGDHRAEVFDNGRIKPHLEDDGANAPRKVCKGSFEYPTTV